MSNTLMIVVHEAKRAADDNGGNLKERLTAAMEASKDHWMVLDKDEQFRGAIGGAMESFGADSEEYEHIKWELDKMKQLSAFMQASQAGLGVDFPVAPPEEPFEPIGMIKMWKDITEK